MQKLIIPFVALAFLASCNQTTSSNQPAANKTNNNASAATTATTSQSAATTAVANNANASSAASNNAFASSAKKSLNMAGKSYEILGDAFDKLPGETAKETFIQANGDNITISVTGKTEGELTTVDISKFSLAKVKGNVTTAAADKGTFYVRVASTDKSDCISNTNAESNLDDIKNKVNAVRFYFSSAAKANELMNFLNGQ